MSISEPTHMHPDIERVLLDAETIRKRVRELGETIARDYSGRPVTLIGILKGCVLFLSDLARSADMDCAMDFMSAASYSGDASTGAVRLLLDLRQNIQGKHVLVIEDIVDTGLTLSYLQQNLRARQPASLEVCTLLDKPECRKIRVQPKYVGFQIPNEFVVGYGLDYNEKYRELPYVGILKRSAVRKGEHSS